ncbi:MAG: esterase-like activity of phytase family protein [Sphingomonadales bacterium]
MKRYILSFLSLLLFFLPVHAQELAIDVHSKAVTFDGNAIAQAAPLEIRNILKLDSSERAFGGISGMRLGPDQRIFMISDAGYFIRAHLNFSKAGKITDLEDVFISALRDPEGQKFQTKSLVDSEALEWAENRDGLFISFEFRHRVWKYGWAGEKFASPLRRPTALNISPILSGLPDNGGIESMARLNDGSLILLSEQGAVSNGRKAWRHRDGRTEPFIYKNPSPYVPTDAVALNEEWLLVLNRHFSPLAGSSARLTLIRTKDIALGSQVTPIPLAQLKPPFPVDNYEAIDVIEGDNGWDVVILSDDNFNPVQKTLLLHLFLPITALPSDK